LIPRMYADYKRASDRPFICDHIMNDSTHEDKMRGDRRYA
jgi:hypothetical protein